MMPMNSGAEAVETAIKICRKWGHEIKKIKENNAKIIVCNNNFHGRTTTLVSFSSSKKSRKNHSRKYCDSYSKSTCCSRPKAYD